MSELERDRGVCAFVYACMKGKQEVIENRAINQGSWVTIIIIYLVIYSLYNFITKHSSRHIASML